ncbi:MOSC domain-containing protein [Fulvivirga sp. M361]|uniref:MOSC domain-containing protein n=1 Tax=Fulvivirga sp. M361 TaxID=2594266 RepID=UPI00117B3A2E|nr:MOSC domain-containing protein [Fulvivirga sp. M361]TRX53772.1 MOSC domain-containing protein [Fulvivirga sp. M361]
MLIKELTSNYYQTGKVTWIGIRMLRKEPLIAVDRISIKMGIGLEGDHYTSENGKRQVTLIQKEHIDAVCSFLNRKELHPSLLRRNIVVSGVNLYALKGKNFKIGNATLTYTGECHPCSRMEKDLGRGGYNALRGHGGITASVLEGGEIKLGDAVKALSTHEY